MSYLYDIKEGQLKGRNACFSTKHQFIGYATILGFENGSVKIKITHAAHQERVGKIGYVSKTHFELQCSKEQIEDPMQVLPEITLPKLLTLYPPSI